VGKGVLIHILTLICLTVFAQDQPNSRTLILPDPGCGNNCRDMYKTGHNDTLFVLRDSIHLYVSADLIEFSYTDLSLLAPPSGIRRDFVPIGSQQILLGCVDISA
jgi:hypothetical protein